MGNFNRPGLPLLFLAILGVALASQVSTPLYKDTLGSVTLYDEDRSTTLELIVPIESSLFGSGKQQFVQDAVDSLKELALVSSSYCAHLDQDAGNHEKLQWGAANSDEPLPSDTVKQIKHKYEKALRELVDAKDLNVEDIKNAVLQNAIRKVVQALPNPKGTNVNVVGCSEKSELVIRLTSDAATDNDQNIKMLEVADYGRFVADKKAFVRIDIARHWAQNKDKNAWYRVDFERCEKSDKGQQPLWICPKSAFEYANDCTPADLNGCPVMVNFTAVNFVNSFSMPNGSVVIASTMPTFVHENNNYAMPTSGVILADLTPETLIRFGEAKVKGRDQAKSSAAFKWNPVNTEANMIFEDNVFEPDFDASSWAFQLSTESSDIITIVGRRTGVLFVTAAFIRDNAWWCVVVSVAIVLSVALTLLTLFCRGRISSAYSKYSPRLQRKRAPSASRSDSSTSTTSEEDPELGAADEEFEAARKKKINLAQFKISLFGEKGNALTDRAPTALETASIDSSESRRTRFYKNILQMVSLPSSKAKKTSDEDTDSNVATDGSDSGVELTSVKVDEKSVVPVTNDNRINIFDIAKFLSQSEIPESELVDVRHTMIRTRRKPNGEPDDRMFMNLVDFFALIKYGTDITPADYDKIKDLEGLPREDCSRFGYALKGLHLKSALNVGRSYRFHHLVRKFPKTYVIEDSQMGKTTMEALYKYNYGKNLDYPSLPVVAVYPPGGHREFLPIECLGVLEDKELIFVSIRLARAAANIEKCVKTVRAQIQEEQQQQTKTTAAKAQPAQ